MCDEAGLDIEQVRRVKDEVEAELLRRPGVTDVRAGLESLNTHMLNQIRKGTPSLLKSLLPPGSKHVNFTGNCN